MALEKKTFYIVSFYFNIFQSFWGNFRKNISPSSEVKTLSVIEHIIIISSLNILNVNISAKI